MNKNKGFTLIEVLIALVILSISLTAIVKATSSDISNNHYLINKSLAHLVAVEAAELIQLGSITFSNNQTEQKTKLGNQEWYWTGSKEKTTNQNIYSVNISVNLNHKIILTETTYILE